MKALRLRVYNSWKMDANSGMCDSNLIYFSIITHCSRLLIQHLEQQQDLLNICSTVMTMSKNIYNMILWQKAGKKKKKTTHGVPVVAQQKPTWLAPMRKQVQSLASHSGLGSGVAVSCDVGCRHSSDPDLLYLWCRLAATAPIQLPAWEPPYVLQERSHKDKKQNKKKKNCATCSSQAHVE